MRKPLWTQSRSKPAPQQPQGLNRLNTQTPASAFINGAYVEDHVRQPSCRVSTSATGEQIAKKTYYEARNALRSSPSDHPHCAPKGLGARSALNESRVA